MKIQAKAKASEAMQHLHQHLMAFLYMCRELVLIVNLILKIHSYLHFLMYTVKGISSESVKFH